MSINEIKPTPLFDKHEKFIINIVDNNTSVSEIKTKYEEFKTNKNLYIAELNSLTKPMLLKRFKYVLGFRSYNSEKKDFIINSIILDFLRDFTLSNTFSYSFNQKQEDVIEEMVLKLNDDDLENYINRVKESRLKRKKEEEALQKSLTNPETYDEYINFLRVNKLGDLSVSQLEQFDSLVSEKTFKVIEEEQDSKNTIDLDLPDDISFTLEQTVHTKKGHDLYVAVINKRIETEKFKELSSVVKRLNGYYSSYCKDGAIAGFQFTEKENALEFMSLEDGEQIKIEYERNSRANHIRLREVATTLFNNAGDVLNADRKVNTYRRANIANHVEANARRDQYIANTMFNIANAMENDKVTYLKKMCTKVSILQLFSILNNAVYKRVLERSNIAKKNNEKFSFEDERAKGFTDDCFLNLEYPYLRLNIDLLNELLDSTKGRDVNKVKKAVTSFKKENKDEYIIKIGNTSYIEYVYTIVKKAPSSYAKDVIEEKVRDYYRFQKADIKNPSMLRMAIREFLPLMGTLEKESPLTVAERDLIGMQIDGFFPTPDLLIESMLDELAIEDGMSVLEPNAGKGNIADYLTSYNVDCIEPVSCLRNILSLKNHNLIGYDLLELEDDKKYDRIIMNPPFENYQDVEHVMKAYQHLKDNGRLVAIMSASPFNNQHSKAVDFRSWLDEVGAVFEENPEGSFKDSERRTMVNTYIVTIDKHYSVMENIDTEDELMKKQDSNIKTITIESLGKVLNSSEEQQRETIKNGGTLLDLMYA